MRKNLIVLFLPIIMASCGINNIVREIEVKNYKAKLDAMMPEKGKNFSLSEKVIDLSLIIDPETEKAKTLRMLKKHIIELKTEISDEGNPEKIIEIMNRYFFEKQMYRFHENFKEGEALPEAESMQKVMETKRGICLSISLLYLITGQELGYEMKGVIVPGHIYVRYIPPGRTGINVETTAKGREFYDYKGVFGIEFLKPEKSAYGIEADNYTVLGAYLNNIGRLKMISGKTNEAEAIFLKSCEMADKIAEPFQNLGILYLNYGENEKARERLLKAFDIMPNYLTCAMLGLVYDRTGNKEEANKFFAMAEEKTYGNPEKIWAVKKIKNGITM